MIRPRFLARLGVLVFVGWVVPAFAQNLLTENPGFEANIAYYTPGWGYPQGAPDALPGWLITLDPSADGYAGSAGDQAPQDLEGANFGYIYSGYGSEGLLETAAGSRAPVDAGSTYTLWFLARGDATWGDALATVSLIWYANNSNTNTKGDPVTLDLVLPARISTEDPMQPFHLSGVAPQAAHYAAVRVTRPAYDYTAMIVDDFAITAEPAQIAVHIKKNSTDAVLSWSRDLKHELEESSEPAATNGWRKVNKPVKGLGATNYVTYPVDAAAHFFRLKKEN